jgi:hypothetical protein
MSDFELGFRDWMAAQVPAMVGWTVWLLICLSLGFAGAFLLALRTSEPTAAGFFKWFGTLGGTLFLIGVVIVSVGRIIGVTWTTGTMGS